jgi:SPP1 gp7 family putative phage head morphogenesis protein
VTPAEVTARIVASHAAIGQVSRRRAVPRERAPDFLEAEYATRLVAEVRQWREAIDPLIASLPSLLASARADDADRTLQRIGLTIRIENQAGSVREWTDSDGTPGSTRMLYNYGEIVGFEGADGEDVDVYIGPVEEPQAVHVVHQRSKRSSFATYDEDKVMLGWDSADAARAAYIAQYDDPRFFGGMSSFTVEDFKRRLRASPGRSIVHERERADDTNEGRRARGVIEHGRSIVRQSMVDVQALAPRLGRSVADQQKVQLARQLKAALGVAIPTADRKVPTQLEHFVAQNVAKIRSLGDRTLDDVERIVADAFTSRMPVDTISALITKRFGVAESFARRIAADQITKLNAQIAQARHQELGIAMFMWWTRGDGLVRDSHAVKHKKVFPYDGPQRPSFLPGEEPGCRCRAVPIFDGIRAAAGIDRRLRL